MNSPQITHVVLVLVLELVEAGSLGGGPADAGAVGLGEADGDEEGLPEALLDLGELVDGLAGDAPVEVEEQGEILQLLTDDETNGGELRASQIKGIRTSIR